MRKFLVGKKGRMLLAVLLGIMFLLGMGMTIYFQIEYRKIAKDNAEAAELAGLSQVSGRPAGGGGHAQLSGSPLELDAATHTQPSSNPSDGMVDAQQSPSPAEETPFGSSAGGTDHLPPSSSSVEEEGLIQWLPDGLAEMEPVWPDGFAFTEFAESLPEEVAVLAVINLEALRAVNEDIVGWIAIPNTELSYPLMQGEDNQYYLSRNWKKETLRSGSIFLESTNSSDFTDFHTIIYGHRMRDGSMFGMIKDYKSLSFWQEHPSVYVVLDGGIYRYDIFSVHESGLKSVVYRLDIEKSGLEEEFIQYCIENSVIGTGLTPGTDEHFLTLSTCTGNGYASRWTVHAFLAQKYEISELGLPR